MEIDTEKIDQTSLALLYLTLHDERRAWKSFAWEVTDRLFEKGLIKEATNKTKAVVFTDAGLKEAESLFKEMFVKTTSSPWRSPAGDK